MVRDDAPSAQYQAIRATDSPGRGRGPGLGSRAAADPGDSRSAREPADADRRIAQSRPVGLSDLLPGVSRRAGWGKRSSIARGRRPIPGDPVARRSIASQDDGRRDLWDGSRGATHGSRPHAALRRQDPRQRSLGRRELRPQPAAQRAWRDRYPMSAAVASRSDLVQKARQAPVARLMLLGAIAAIVGGIVLVLGLFSGHPERAWWAYHTNFMFWAGLAQAMVVFAATIKLAKGHWAGVVIRFAEAGVAFTTVAVVLFIG